MANASPGYNGIPVYYDYQNLYDSQFRPFGMHAIQGSHYSLTDIYSKSSFQSLTSRSLTDGIRTTSDIPCL